MNRTIAVSINSTWNFVNFRLGLLRGLQDAGYRIVAIAPEDEHSDRLRAMGVEVRPIDIARRRIEPIAELRLVLRYYTILRELQPSALLTFTIKPNVYGSLAAARLRIPTLANVAGLGTAFLDQGPINRLVRWLYRTALRTAGVVFFQNANDLDLFVREGLVVADKTRLLPGSGVDLKKFRPSARTPCDEEAPVFLMMARLLWAKGIGEYAEAAALVHATWPRARFCLLGIPEESKGAVPLATIQSMQERGDIEYLGSATDVRPHLAQADCVVLPSYYPEGTPRSLLEAAAMGLPIITTDTPGCRDVVIPRANGYLCTPRDSRSLAKRMEAFARLQPFERIRMGQASRNHAERCFDERKIIEAYLEALDEILDPYPAGHPADR